MTNLYKLLITTNLIDYISNKERTVVDIYVTLLNDERHIRDFVYDKYATYSNVVNYSVQSFDGDINIDVPEGIKVI